MFVPVGISGLPDSSVPPLRQKENPENLLPCHSSGPEVPGCSAMSFANFHSPLWFVLYIPIVFSCN